MRLGDDASALDLLKSGRIQADTLLPFVVAGVTETAPVIFPAVLFLRDQVVRALVRLGANIDELRIDSGGRRELTPAGHAIYCGNVSALALCHRLGASMSFVSGIVDDSAVECSAIFFAVSNLRCACLEYLLDSVFPARPLKLSMSEMVGVAGTAAKGGAGGRPICEVFVNRGNDFKLFAEFYNDYGERGQTSMADLMFATAQASGDVKFMRYVVKTLGLSTTTGHLNLWKAECDLNIPGSVESEVPEAPLTKYDCVGCEAVCATKFCTGCRVARYCSKECSVKHWKTGGHKKVCKELQRVAALESSSSAGPSNQ